MRWVTHVIGCVFHETNPVTVMTIQPGLALVAFSSFAIGSCSQSVNSVYHDVMYVTEFPVAVGLHWTYEVRRKYAVKPDTLTVRITGRTTIAGVGEAYVWEYKGWDRSYVRWTVQRHDTLLTFDDQKYPSESIVFPLRVGATWNGPKAGTTTTVQQRLDTSVQSRPFWNCLALDRDSWGYNYRAHDRILLAPGIGLVHGVYGELDLGALNADTLELISFGRD